MQYKTIKIKLSSEVPKNYTGIAEYPYGSKFYYLNGLIHREDGPAVEYSNGYKIYSLNNNFLIETKQIQPNK